MALLIWIWAAALIVVVHAAPPRFQWCRSNKDVACVPVPSSSRRLCSDSDDEGPDSPSAFDDASVPAATCQICNVLQPAPEQFAGLYHDLFHRRSERRVFYQSAETLLAFLAENQDQPLFSRFPALNEVVRVYDCMMLRFPFVFDRDGRIDALFHGCSKNIKDLIAGLRLTDRNAGDAVLAQRLDLIAEQVDNRRLPSGFFDLREATAKGVIAFLKEKLKLGVLREKKVLRGLLYAGIRFSLREFVTKVGFSSREQASELFPLLYVVDPHRDPSALPEEELLELLKCICVCKSSETADALLSVPAVFDLIRAHPNEFLEACADAEGRYGAALFRRVARADQHFIRRVAKFGQDSQGTILHRACRAADIALIEAVLESECDAALKDNDGQVAISLLPETAMMELLQKLEARQIRALIESAPGEFLQRYALAQGVRFLDPNSLTKFVSAVESDALISENRSIFKTLDGFTKPSEIETGLAVNFAACRPPSRR